MLAYRISPEFQMILIRMSTEVSIDRMYEFINTITSDKDYDPGYRIIVNNKPLEESEEVNRICHSIDLAASVIGGFFSQASARRTEVCYCRR